MELPILYKLDKSGRIRYWECVVKGNTYSTRHGVLHLRHKHNNWNHHKRGSQYTPDHGSHKTAEEVAALHAKSDWKTKKRMDSMTTDLESLRDPLKAKYAVPIAPVLATRYEKLLERHNRYQSWVEQGKNPTKTMYTFPDREFYWEPKYDGQRLTVSFCKDPEDPNSQRDVRFYSRGRIEKPHLDPQREFFRKLYSVLSQYGEQYLDCHFDCESMEPEEGRNQLHSIISRTKTKHEDNDKIVFYIFDIILEYGVPYSKRREILEQILGKMNHPNIKLVKTIGKAKINDPIVREWRDRACEEGFEGVMGKDPDFIYPMSNQRIEGIVKFKTENDEEYEICGAFEGKDYHRGMIVLEVRDINGKLIKFKVTPCWTHDERREAWKIYQESPEKFIGKLVTVVYKYKNEYGKPEEARAIRMRSRDDLSKPLNKSKWSKYGQSYHDRRR